jgi:hypothetical protein
MAPFGRWFGDVGEEVAETVQATFPGGTPLDDPLLGGAEWSGGDGESAHAADFLRGDQAAAFEDLEVLDDGGEGHRQGRGELGDGCGSLTEAIDQGAPSRIGEGLEDAIEGRAVGQRGHYLSYRYTKAIP